MSKENQTSITVSKDVKSDLQRFKSDKETWDDALQRITNVLSRVIRETDEEIVGEAATEAEALERLLDTFDGEVVGQLNGDETPEVRLSEEEFERLSENLQKTVRDTIYNMQ